MIDAVDFYGLINMAIISGAAFGIAAILIKIFPSLKKVSWKIIVVLFALSRIPDVLTAILYFLKVGSIGLEANYVAGALYNWLGFTSLFFFASVLAAALVALFLAWAIKFFICGKASIGYYLGYGLIIGSFLAAFTNYFSYLR